nr:hypothetical protein [Tanacetum cinerariifolium]
MDAPPSPNHVLNFPEAEFEEDPQEEPKEEVEEYPEEDPEVGPEEDPKEGLEEDPEAEAEDDVPPPVTPPVGYPITPPPLSESSSDTEDDALNEALEMPPVGSKYEVGGPSSVTPYPPFHLHGSEIARLDGNTELLLSNVQYLKRYEKKRRVDMETCSSEIRKGKKRMDKIEQDLGDEMQFSNVVEHRVTDLENKEHEKDEEMVKEDKVMFAASTFEGRALTRWNENVHTLGLVTANRIPWTEFKSMMTIEYCPVTEIQKMEEELWTLTLKGDDIEAYNNCFHELALMCPDLVPNEKKKIERYMKGFPKRIKGNITFARPTTLHEAVNLARELVEQANRRQETARAYAAAPTEGKTYTGNLPKCNRCNLHHIGRCPPKCRRCQRMGHIEADCRTRLLGIDENPLRNVTCYGCGEKGHLRHLCPKGRNQRNEGARARAYVVAENPQQNPNVVTGMFLLNDHYASVLFDSGAERSFVSIEFTPFINISPVALNTSYDVELAHRKI